MRTDLTVRAVHLGGMRVDVQIRDHVVPIDYPAEAGRNPTPLEMLLASLAACAGNTLHLVLSRKMGVSLASLEVEARAERRQEHPTLLTKIDLVYHLRGDGLQPEIVDQALKIAEDQLCPVLAMLRPGAEINSSWRSD
jgi:putative redox protein